VQVAGLTVSCAAGGCDLSLSAEAAVVNRGARRARRTRLGFFLSQDGRRDRSDSALGRKRVRAIRGKRRRRSETRLRATGLAPGTYHLIACADVARRVRERRERNNCRAGRPFTVQAPAAPAPGPGALPPAAGGCTEPGWRMDLCAEIGLAMANRAFFDMADALTFALLYQHHRTGQAIPSSVAAGAIEPIQDAWDPVRGQAGISTYRVSGFLDFWVFSTYAGVDWPRYPDAMDTAEEFLSWWQTYGIVQFTARQNAINHRLNAIVESEVAWRNAIEEWKAYDLSLITAQQYSDATVFAHRTLEDARTAVDAAESAIKGPP
ncbi:MAG: hypothetical protein ACRDPC_29295, partial [Solirubrobacteraceae bacterium]